MSGVVLRCPNCGTTQGRPGECEACSEGEVRYFCGNHSSGLWLDGPICVACGARFGVAPSPPPPAPRVGPTTPRRSTPPSASGGKTRTGSGPARAEPRRPPAPVPDEPAAPSLAEMIVDLLEEGERARSVETTPRPEPEPVAPRTLFPVAGCLVRIVVLVFLSIALLVFALFLWAGGALGGLLGEREPSPQPMAHTHLSAGPGPPG